MSTNQEHVAGWVAVVRCPVCLDEHRVLWPHPSFPPNRRVKIDCPSTEGEVVLPATAWARLSDAAATKLGVEWTLADPFYE